MASRWTAHRARASARPPRRWARRAEHPHSPAPTPAPHTAAAGAAVAGPLPPAPAAAQRRGPTCVFSQSTATVPGPICWSKAAVTAASSGDVGPRRFDTTSGHTAKATRCHGVIGRGWPPYAAASSGMGRAPRRASRTTFAFNSPLGGRRGLDIVAFSPRALIQPYGMVQFLGYNI